MCVCVIPVQPAQSLPEGKGSIVFRPEESTAAALVHGILVSEASRVDTILNVMRLCHAVDVDARQFTETIALVAVVRYAAG